MCVCVCVCTGHYFHDNINAGVPVAHPCVDSFQVHKITVKEQDFKEQNLVYNFTNANETMLQKMIIPIKPNLCTSTIIIK